MKQDALKKIHKNGSSLLNSYSSGELITIANSDPHSVYMMYVELIPYIIDMIFYVGVAVYFLIRMDALLLIVPLGSRAVRPADGMLFKKRFRSLRRNLAEKHQAEHHGAGKHFRHTHHKILRARKAAHSSVCRG